MAWDSKPNIVQRPDGVEFTAKWFSTPALIAGAIGIYLVFDLLSGFVVQVWPGIGSRPGPWLALLGIIAAGALGYAALACCINRTRVEIRAAKIIISNGPLPWPGKKIFEINDIRMIYNTMALRFKHYRRSKNIISFVVMAVTGNNQHIQLLKAASRENADEIEKIINAQLGLKPAARPKANQTKPN
jgi:hypothetical protein